MMWLARQDMQINCGMLAQRGFICQYSKDTIEEKTTTGRKITLKTTFCTIFNFNVNSIMYTYYTTYIYISGI